MKKGFQGSSGDSPSAKALALLRAQGIKQINIDGRLSSTRVIERDIEGRKTPYLNVRLRDADGVYNLSISLAQRCAQMLARKLYNADPGVETVIKLFGTFTTKPGATRGYADHGASLKQDGHEVVGVNPMDELSPRVNTALDMLKEAGVDDAETLAKRRSKIEVDFHNELMSKVAVKFTEYYASREQADPTGLPDVDESLEGLPAFADLDEVPF